MRSALVVVLALSGCIIVSDGNPEDGTTSGGDGAVSTAVSQTGLTTGGGPESDSADDVPPLDESDAADVLDEGTGDTGDTGDTGGGLRGCEGNVLADPGFESGTPNDAWSEGSDVFGSPLCDASCSEDAGAEPYAGDWWAWFGGVEEPDTQFVAQSFVVDADAAALGFWFQVNSGSGTGDDMLAVTIDGETVYMATDFDTDINAYSLIVVDISAWADGVEHELRFEASVAGNGLTNFFVDEVTIAPCDEPMGTTGGSGSTSSTGSTGGGSTGSGSTGSGSTGSGSSSTG